MSIEYFNLTSPFLERPFEMEIYSPRGSPKESWLILNIHGSFGSIYGGGEKYRKIAQQLSFSHGHSVILYQSGRLCVDQVIKSNPFLKDFSLKVALFEGKSFEDELHEATMVLERSLQKIGEKSHRTAESVKVAVNGNSFGGLVALALTEKFPQIHIVQTVGTGIRDVPRDEALLRTVPPPLYFRSCIENFSGKIIIHRALADMIVPVDAYQRLIDFSKNQDLLVFCYPGVDHQFERNEQGPTDKPLREVWVQLTNVLKDEAR